jgi:hypothetical protein
MGCRKIRQGLSAHILLWRALSDPTFKVGSLSAKFKRKHRNFQRSPPLFSPTRTTSFASWTRATSVRLVEAILSTYHYETRIGEILLDGQSQMSMQHMFTLLSNMSNIGRLCNFRSLLLPSWNFHIKLFTQTASVTRYVVIRHRQLISLIVWYREYTTPTSG